ncbi:hypothetical protein PHYPSEUDO_003188 [Phytophthora pseudosyringae]|uniref:Uncharacterized protein n=1 Tax=Phytophthora pseudosyringae TaxID=221518 RepID=A0A8T1VSK5_9STRA|nr:hypothetical protein PHYPSEUDO_003188 [Phytophthora pseudosyringae]
MFATEAEPIDQLFPPAASPAGNNKFRSANCLENPSEPYVPAKVIRFRRSSCHAYAAIAMTGRRSSLVANILCVAQSSVAAIAMGQPTESPTSAGAVLPSSPLGWDGKCQNCRKLMSRCVCFQESEGDAAPFHTSAAASPRTADASETRPLWNALRKMHRQSAAARLVLVQPPTSARPSGSRSKENLRKRSEALPPLSAPSGTSTPRARHPLHRRSDARPPQSSTRRGSREPGREPSPERPSITSRKGQLQRAGITSSRHSLKRDAKDAGVMRSVRSTSSIDKRGDVGVSRPKEKLSDGPEEGSPHDDENDETVWEL